MKQYNIYDSDCDKEDLSSSIEPIKRRWLQAKASLEDAKYIEQLIFSDYIRTIRSFKTTWDYCIPMIELAVQEVDKKKKKERENISFIEHKIKETFFEDEKRFDIKINKIISGGYESYHWQMYFVINNIEYAIQIPSREKLTTNNFIFAQEGKFAFIKRISPSCTCVQFTDWSEEGLAKKIKDYFSTELNVNEVD